MQEEINGRIIKVFRIDNLTGVVLAKFAQNQAEGEVERLILCRLPHARVGTTFHATGNWKAAPAGQPQPMFAATEAVLLENEEMPGPRMG